MATVQTTEATEDIMISDLQTILDIQASLDNVACGFDAAAVELRSLWIEAIFC